MIAQQVSTVPNQTQGPPAQLQNGGGSGAFGDQLAALTQPGVNSTGDLAASAASESAPTAAATDATTETAAKTAKTSKTSKADDSAQSASKTSSAAPTPVAGLAQNAQAPDANAASSGKDSKTSAITLANGKDPLAAGSPYDGTAARDDATPGAFAAPTAKDSASGFAIPGGLSGGKQDATSAKGTNSQTKTPSATAGAKLTGSTPGIDARSQSVSKSDRDAADKPAAPTTNVATNQPSTSAATSAAAQRSPSSANAGPAQPHAPTAAASAVPSQQDSSTAAASNTPPHAVNSSHSSAMVPSGAAELNARVTGSGKTSSQPSTASASADYLMQPHDPNQGVMPPSTAGRTSEQGEASATSGVAPANGKTASHDIAASTGSAAHSRNPEETAAHAQAAAHREASDAASAQGNQPGASASNSGVLPPATPNASSSASQANSPTPSTSPMPTALVRPALAALAGDQVAVQLKQAIQNGTNQIQIQLKPESLGSIGVKLNVSHDGKLTAIISASRPDTLNLLKQDSSNLQQALRNAGFQADSGSLSFNLGSGDPQSFSQNGSSQSSSPNIPNAMPFGGESSVPPTAYWPREHSGSLDIHV